MKLFGHPDSGHAYKVRLFLHVAKIPHDYEEVDIFASRDSRPEEFRQHARFSEVPTLVDGGRGFVQSNAILIHLAQHIQAYGAEDAERFSRCLEWLFWEANKIGMCLPQLRASRKFGESRLSPGADAWLRRRFEHDIGLMDAALSDGRRFIIDDQPPIADFSLCGYLYFAQEADVQVPRSVDNWLTQIAELEGWSHPYDFQTVGIPQRN